MDACNPVRPPLSAPRLGHCSREQVVKCRLSARACGHGKAAAALKASARRLCLLPRQREAG
jgi:hypothetical protein